MHDQLKHIDWKMTILKKSRARTHLTKRGEEQPEMPESQDS